MVVSKKKNSLPSSLTSKDTNDAMIISPSTKGSVEHNDKSQKRSAIIKREIHRCVRAGLVSDYDIVPSDHDVWIERSYKTAKGRTVRFYYSMLTNQMALLQPPTGAAYVLYEHDIIRENNTMIQEYVDKLPPMTKELFGTMRKPQKDIAFLESIGFECQPMPKTNILNECRKMCQSILSKASPTADKLNKKKNIIQ